MFQVPVSFQGLNRSLGPDNKGAGHGARDSAQESRARGTGSAAEQVCLGRARMKLPSSGEMGKATVFMTTGHPNNLDGGGDRRAASGSVCREFELGGTRGDLRAWWPQLTHPLFSSQFSYPSVLCSVTPTPTTLWCQR